LGRDFALYLRRADSAAVGEHIPIGHGIAPRGNLMRRRSVSAIQTGKFTSAIPKMLLTTSDTQNKKEPLEKEQQQQQPDTIPMTASSIIHGTIQHVAVTKGTTIQPNKEHIHALIHVTLHQKTRQTNFYYLIRH
jgi:hypothetical protein